MRFSYTETAKVTNSNSTKQQNLNKGAVCLRTDINPTIQTGKLFVV